MIDKASENMGLESKKDIKEASEMLFHHGSWSVVLYKLQ